MLRQVTSKQVGVVSKCRVDGGVHSAWSVIIDSSDVDWIRGSVQSIVSQTP